MISAGDDCYDTIIGSSSSMRCASIDVMSKLLVHTPPAHTDPQLSHAPLKTRAPTVLLQNVR